MRKFARFVGFRDDDGVSRVLAAIGWIGSAGAVAYFFDFTLACLVIGGAALLYCIGTCKR